MACRACGAGVKGRGGVGVARRGGRAGAVAVAAAEESSESVEMFACGVGGGADQLHSPRYRAQRRLLELFHSAHFGQDGLAKAGVDQVPCALFVFLRPESGMVSRVMEGLLWPKASCTVLTLAPPKINAVAK